MVAFCLGIQMMMKLSVLAQQAQVEVRDNRMESNGIEWNRIE